MSSTPSPKFPTSAGELLSRAQAAALSGLELMQGAREGRYPAAPIAELAQIALTEVEEGRVLFLGQPGFQHYNPQGTVHGGWFGTALDSAMGCAVMTRLPRGQSYTTLEYKVNMLRPVFETTGGLRIIGETIHVGRRTATAEGRIEDAAGKIYATGTTTCLVLTLTPDQA